MLIAKVYNDAFIAPPHLDAPSRLDFRRDALEYLSVWRNGTRMIAIDLAAH
jgi:hypothetical protein